MKLSDQKGFGGMQMFMAVAIIGAVSVIAVPKYNAMMDKSKITEAFNIAGESKRKLSQYYMVNSRFPQNNAEAAALKTGTLSPPEHVRDMSVEAYTEAHDLVIKVYLKPGAVENTGYGDQYIYWGADETPGASSAIVWTCGAVGIGADMLPDNCQS
jgi:Tfp pilus assembly protein PilE